MSRLLGKCFGKQRTSLPKHLPLSLDARLSVTEIVVPNPVFVNLLHITHRCSDIDKSPNHLYNAENLLHRPMEGVYQKDTRKGSVMKTKALKAALPHTLPICVGFLFLGMSYGFLMKSRGFPFFYPMFMSLFIFAGSMELVTVSLLLSAFNPFYAFFLALMVNARHLFYGISMLEKYRHTGWKKAYLIFGLCDETFTINCTAQPAGVDRGWFLFFVTLLNQTYWVTGATLGALLGYVIRFDTTGIEFGMTALFVVMFLSQWEEHKDHRPALTGLGCSLASLALLGPGAFILPAMALIILFLSLTRLKSRRTEAV